MNFLLIIFSSLAIGLCSQSAETADSSCNSFVQKYNDINPDELFTEKHPMDDFEAMESVESGQFSTVFKAVRGGDTPPVALKQVYFDDQKWKMLLREVKILHVLDHPNIVRFYKAYRLDKVVWLAMEWIQGGSLEQFSVQNSKRVGDIEHELLRNVLKDVLKALTYLQTANIVHRDLKPDNIMLMNSTEGISSKLIDFGLSSEPNQRDNQQTRVCGSPLFSAPEVLTGDGRYRKYGCKADIWSLGVCILCMFVEPFPGWPDMSEPDFIHSLKSKRGPWGPWSEIADREMLAVVKKCLVWNPAFRVSADSLLSNHFS